MSKAYDPPVTQESNDGGSERWKNPSREEKRCKRKRCKKRECKKVTKSAKMMRAVSEFEELNKAVRAPNDVNGRTARLIHVAEDERMTPVSYTHLTLPTNREV